MELCEDKRHPLTRAYLKKKILWSSFNIAGADNSKLGTTGIREHLIIVGTQACPPVQIAY